MDLTTITPAVFKAYFNRDFPYAINGNTSLDYVQDSDITRAFSMAIPGFNQALFDSDATVETAFLLLSAHYLSLNLSTSAGGINGSGYSGPVSARTVGNVSETYRISTAFVDNPILGFLARTGYGQQYLEFITPYLIGGFGIAYGTSQP